MTSFGSKDSIAQMLPVYFVLALINLRAKLLVTSTWFNGSLERNHGLLLNFDYTNNEQSRVLQYYIPEFFHKLFGMSVPDAYILQRLLFVFITFCAFHLYLRKWFDQRGAMLGVVFLAAIMPLTYFNHLQESAPLLMLMFLLCLWAIRENRHWLYAGLLLVGAMANETVLIIPAVYWFYQVGELNWKKPEWPRLFRVSVMTLITCAPAYAWTILIRYITRDAEHLGGAWHLPDNLASIGDALLSNPLDWWNKPYLYIFIIFGAMWVYAYLRWADKPLFLRRASLMVPLFVISHMLTGIILEVRQMIPISYIIIPMALLYLIPMNESDEPATAKKSKKLRKGQSR